MKEIAQVPKTHLILLSDRLAKYLILLIFMLCILTALIHLDHPSYAIGIIMALLIVTCPCALGIAIPLTHALFIQKALSEGIIIKNADVLEKISHVNHIFMDKTGTLTQGILSIQEWIELQSVPQLKNIVLGLEKDAKHPIGISIAHALREEKIQAVPLKYIQEIPGKGIKGVYDGDNYEIKQEKQGVYSTVGVYRNTEQIARISLSDTLRIESHSILDFFKNQHIAIEILTGDSQGITKTIAESLNVSYRAEMSPEEKYHIIQQYPHAMMVGDGANDAAALKKSFIGIAVQASLEISLKSADVYLTAPGLTGVKTLWTLGKKCRRVIIQNLIFALIYNIIGITLALSGYMNPLWAAILMPLSSLTVLLSSIQGARL
jgi:Cu2+-exporting ATPase/Cu+-exporting ATPase